MSGKGFLPVVQGKEIGTAEMHTSFSDAVRSSQHQSASPSVFLLWGETLNMRDQRSLRRKEMIRHLSLF